MSDGQQVCGHLEYGALGQIHHERVHDNQEHLHLVCGCRPIPSLFIDLGGSLRRLFRLADPNLNVSHRPRRLLLLRLHLFRHILDLLCSLARTIVSLRSRAKF